MNKIKQRRHISNGDTMYYYLNAFFLFSILGHFLEEFFYTKEPGILIGFWTPIYGLGSVIILLLYSYLKKQDIKKKWIEVLLVFLNGFVILSLLELLGGILIEKIFKTTFWDYTNHPLSIGKYTSLPMAFLWGISSLVLAYGIKKLVDPILNNIPKWVSLILYQHNDNAKVHI